MNEYCSNAEIIRLMPHVCNLDCEVPYTGSETPCGNCTDFRRWSTVAFLKGMGAVQLLSFVCEFVASTIIDYKFTDEQLKILGCDYARDVIHYKYHVADNITKLSLGLDVIWAVIKETPNDGTFPKIPHSDYDSVKTNAAALLDSLVAFRKVMVVCWDDPEMQAASHFIHYALSQLYYVQGWFDQSKWSMDVALIRLFEPEFIKECHDLYDYDIHSDDTIRNGRRNK